MNRQHGFQCHCLSRYCLSYVVSARQPLSYPRSVVSCEDHAFFHAGGDDPSLKIIFKVLARSTGLVMTEPADSGLRSSTGRERVVNKCRGQLTARLPLCDVGNRAASYRYHLRYPEKPSPEDSPGQELLLLFMRRRVSGREKLKHKVQYYAEYGCGSDSGQL